jgi:MFS family permease
MITAFHLLAIFVEAPLLAWSERVRVGRFSAAALFTFALACFGAALANGPLLFVLALALYGPASGCALAASEGLLVETRRDERERTIARLTLAGALGDLAVPLLLGALAWLDLGWRTGMRVAGGAALLLAFVHGTSRELDRLPPKERDDDVDDPRDGSNAEAHAAASNESYEAADEHEGAADASDEHEDAAKEHDAEEEEDEPSVLESLRFALSHRRLLAWCAAVALTNWLDEVLVAFVMVRLDHASSLERAIAVASWTIGFLPGLLLLDRHLARLDTRRALYVAAAVAALALLVLAVGPSVPVACLALGTLGAATSVLYPLAEARRYAALPGRPALVHAVGALFTPFDALTPLALGALALAFGPEAALLAIVLAPLGLALAAWKA